MADEIQVYTVYRIGCCADKANDNIIDGTPDVRVGIRPRIDLAAGA